MRPALVPLALAGLMLLMVLAGCSSKAPQASAITVDCAKTPDDPTCKVATDAKTGAVSGIVIDPAIKPLAGATVTLTIPSQKARTATTTAGGTFAFSNVPPGTYFLKVTKPGYVTGQSSVDVVAGTQPMLTKIILQADPAAKPAYEVYHFEGYIECSVRYVANALAACASLPSGVGNDKFSVEYPVGGNLSFAYSEMVWDATNEFGKSLKVEYTDDSDGGLDNFVIDQGESPLYLRANKTDLAGKVTADNPLLIRVFTGSYADSGASVTVEQSFDIYTVLFYGFTPPADYVFGRDGDPKLPA